MGIKRLSLIRWAVACWFSRLACVGTVSRSRAADAAMVPMRRRLVESSRWFDAGCGGDRPTLARSGVRDRSSPGISFHARCTVFSCLLPFTSHPPPPPEFDYLRRRSASAGSDRWLRRWRGPGERSRNAVRLCSVGLRTARTVRTGTFAIVRLAASRALSDGNNAREHCGERTQAAGGVITSRMSMYMYVAVVYAVEESAAAAGIETFFTCCRHDLQRQSSNTARPTSFQASSLSNNGISWTDR